LGNVSLPCYSDTSGQLTLTHCSDFADQYTGAEVIGTDLSPCQPEWVPPNVQFEVDDATERWTWGDNHFGFIHIRYLFGAIADWHALFKEAYRCCAPGGWVESVEADVRLLSDDGTDELEPVLKVCDKMYEEGGKALGRPFFVGELQVEGLQEAGFVDIKTVDYKVRFAAHTPLPNTYLTCELQMPIGSWPKDPKMAQVGRFVQLTLENDLEGEQAHYLT
jgi:SAM-dependent methyltransferase